VVQETYLRYQAVPPATITSPRALLTTIVTRLCLNQLQSARAQRETYVGPWLPEPLPGGSDPPPTPADRILLQESLAMAFLVLLEQLTPLERAVFLLREVFAYDYAEIAAIVGKEEAACRQSFSRAKKHIVAHRPRFAPDRAAHRQLLDRFVHAVSGGDMAGLIGLLAADVTMWADGGGKARGAATRPLHGREAVARFVLGSTRLPEEPYDAEITDVNGEPALILRTRSHILAVLFVEADGSQIRQVFAVANPDKLRRLEQA
jgi:RNA polymerase sigma-70 factor (ECF subfamily)